jgi:hypothetical protein
VVQPRPVPPHRHYLRLLQRLERLTRHAQHR